MNKKFISPFVLGGPIDPEMFVGRSENITTLINILDTSFAGNARFSVILGDTGMGKSSLANKIRDHAERVFNAFTIHLSFSEVVNRDEVIRKIVEQTGNKYFKLQPNIEKLKILFGEKTFESKGVLAQLIQSGLKINKKIVDENFDYTNIHEIFQKIANEENNKGFLLILDDLDKVSKDESFVGFLKTLMDTLRRETPRLPFSMILCATENLLSDMVRLRESLNRYFKVIELGPLSINEIITFYGKAFDSVEISQDFSKEFYQSRRIKGLDSIYNPYELMAKCTGGYPVFVGELGEAVFNVIKKNNKSKCNIKDVDQGIYDTSHELGQKYLRQFYHELQSSNHKIILENIAEKKISETFSISDLKEILKEENISENSISNFLKKFRDKGLFNLNPNRKTYSFTNKLYYYCLTSRIFFSKRQSIIKEFLD